MVDIEELLNYFCPLLQYAVRKWADRTVSRYTTVAISLVTVEHYSSKERPSKHIGNCFFLLIMKPFQSFIRQPQNIMHFFLKVLFDPPPFISMAPNGKFEVIASIGAWEEAQYPIP